MCFVSVLETAIHLVAIAIACSNGAESFIVISARTHAVTPFALKVCKPQPCNPVMQIRLCLVVVLVVLATHVESRTQRPLVTPIVLRLTVFLCSEVCFSIYVLMRVCMTAPMQNPRKKETTVRV